jgi:hypothetical protein
MMGSWAARNGDRIDIPMRTLAALVLPLILVAACNQNIESVSSGERLEDAPPVAPASSAPFGPAADGEPEVPPFVKAFFMHTWVEALYSVPANQSPNPEWVSPLLDPTDGRVVCTDCHVSGQVDFSRIPKQRLPMVDDFENDHEFMADLMKKWVGRLNSSEFGARAKLTGSVTCLTCHETNPDP